jgi:thiamine-monophosphate kinase
MAEDLKPGQGHGLGEFALIARYFAPLATSPGSLSLRDDCAILAPPEGHELIVTCDTIIEGVHFRPDDPPETVGHKALAVNLSDLAAKGARPYAYLLALTLPERFSPTWLEGFASGLCALQDEAGISLVGGDTTAGPGPLSVTITALGLVPQGYAVLRTGAKIGHKLYVSGSIGDACLGLRLLEDPAVARSWGLAADDAAFLIGRYRRPNPRNALALLIRNFAQAAIDVSDGLVGDIEKLCQVSHVSARIEANRVPLSQPARKAVAQQPSLLKELVAAGDDYEIVAMVPEASAPIFEAEALQAGVEVTAIGDVVAGEGEALLLDQQGVPIELRRKGFAHF